MNLVDWLRKLGILRNGAEGAVYHNAAERPASFQTADVFNSQKDVIDFNLQDARQPESGHPSKEE